MDNYLYKRISYFIIIQIVVIFCGTILLFNFAQATSGACSDHQGVKVGVSDIDGSVVCNDGWVESSVLEKDMAGFKYLPSCNGFSPNCKYLSDNYSQYWIFASKAIKNIDEMMSKIYYLKNLKNHTSRFDRNVDYRLAENILYYSKGKIQKNQIDYLCVCTVADEMLDIFSSDDYGYRVAKLSFNLAMINLDYELVMESGPNENIIKENVVDVPPTKQVSQTSGISDMVTKMNNVSNLLTAKSYEIQKETNQMQACAKKGMILLNNVCVTPQQYCKNLNTSDYKAVFDNSSLGFKCVFMAKKITESIKITPSETKKNIVVSEEPNDYIPYSGTVGSPIRLDTMYVPENNIFVSSTRTTVVSSIEKSKPSNFISIFNTIKTFFRSIFRLR